MFAAGCDQQLSVGVVFTFTISHWDMIVHMYVPHS